MLSRNDMTVLMQQVDVGKALDLLTKLKTDGRIDGFILATEKCGCQDRKTKRTQREK